MQISIKEYNIINDAYDIITENAQNTIKEYSVYLRDNPPNKNIEKRLSLMSDLEYNLRLFLNIVSNNEEENE